MNGAEHETMLRAGLRNGLRPSGRAFTLIEVLVVVGILALLIAILIPSLVSAQQSARKTVCLANQRQIGVAVHAYAQDHGGRIAYGPKAPPMLTATSFYPSTGAPTSLISLMNGAPVGLGLLLKGHLTKQPQVLFCPGSDQPVDASAELALVGVHQAQCSYYYRHGSVTRQYDNGEEDLPPSNIQLDNLGRNRNGQPIRALAIDTMFLCPPNFAVFSVKPRTHHRQKTADILFADGHSISHPNTDNRFTVDLGSYEALRNAFDHILAVLERADTVP
jgi:prepilin-type N-terminal cleavage/methylation domain-containing protein/prepilin-type processing-associated H-X9-DG protein